MADKSPSIVVRVLGDLKGLASSMGDAAKTAETAGSRAHAAFSGMLATLNRTGVLGPFGEALNGVDEALGAIESSGKRVGSVMMGVGGTVTGIGVALSALGSKEQSSHQQLVAAVEASGKSYDDYGEAVDKAIKHNENFGQSSAATQDALRVLTQATGDPAKALQLLGTATDLAAAKHEDLTSAATALGKVYNGNTKLLKEFGVTAGETAKQAMTQLTTATKQAQTADQQAADAKQKLADLQERLGASAKSTVVSTNGLAAAQDKLSAAQNRLNELTAIDASKGKLTLQQQFALKDARSAVASATQGVTTAQQNYSKAQDAANAKSGLTVAQQQALRNAQQKVAETAAAATAAHSKLTQAQQANTKAAGSQQNEMDQLSKKLSGQAAASVDSFTGKMKVLGTKIEDQTAQFAQKYGPAITAAGGAVTVMGGAIDTAGGVMKAFKGTQEAATAATEASTAATDAATASGWLALGPILLIIVAIAALVAAAYLIYRNWNTIWAAMKAVVVDAWNWIKTNWPLLLAILLGPIGLAIAGIVKYWAQIKAGAADVINWVKANWPLLVAIITGPIGIAVLMIQHNWQTIKDGAADAVQWIKDRFNDVVGFFEGLPGRMGGIFSGMFHGITDAFRSAINALIDIWNSLNFTIGGWKVGPITTPSVSVGMPHIPHLAQGGIITRDGLIYAHAGEAITPARSGPGLNVEKVEINNGMDLETFMRKAAWHVQTLGV
jgi:hypothetical protein